MRIRIRKRTRTRPRIKIRTRVKIIPFLDCDTVGSEWTNQEEVRTTGETVFDCKDRTNNAPLHVTPRKISKRLNHARSVHDCAHDKLST